MKKYQAVGSNKTSVSKTQRHVDKNQTLASKVTQEHLLTGQDSKSAISSAQFAG